MFEYINSHYSVERSISFVEQVFEKKMKILLFFLFRNLKSLRGNLIPGKNDVSTVAISQAVQYFTSPTSNLAYC